MVKKIIVFFSVLAMGCFVQASAAPQFSESVAPLLAELKIIHGDPDGNLRLDDFVTRAECTKVAVAASQWRDLVGSGSKTSPYKDVPASDWSAPYVTIAAKNGICSGYLDSTFKPHQLVSYEEALTMFLRVLGYSDEDFGISWPDSQIGIAESIGLCDGLDKTRGQNLVRRDIMIIVYNLLNTSSKGGQTDYLSEFDRVIIDDVILIASGREDSSVGAGKILTSSGTFKVGEEFDYSLIGRRGSIVVRDGDTLTSFIPNVQKIEEYVVSDVNNEEIFFGSSVLDVEEGTLVYYKSNSYTYESIIPQIDSGDVCIVFRDDYGSVDYILFVRGERKASLTEANFSEYVVYSVLNDGVITYNNGKFDKVKFAGGTVFYEDDELTSYAGISQKMEMGDKLKIRYKPNGETDYVIYEKGNMSSPVIVRNSFWHTELGADVSSTSFIRDGNRVSYSDIEINDVVYYLPELNMVLAYSDKVTGIYETASPNKDTPSSVVISGVAYFVESVDAFVSLSSSGEFSYGDTVTLLLGKDGDVAGVVDRTSLSREVFCGYLIESGNKETVEGLVKITKPYIRVILPSGQSVEYISDKVYDDVLNSIVEVEFVDGIAEATTVGVQKELAGTFRWSGSSGMLGSTRVRGDVKILDVSTIVQSASGNASAVFPSRLDGVKLSADDVLYAEKDNDGKISSLIINDVTGDMYSYGIITNVEKRNFEMSIMGTYTYLSKGFEKTVSTNGVLYNVSKSQPVQIVISENGMFEGIRQLEKTASGKGTKFSDMILSLDGRDYRLSDEADIYVKSVAGEYSMITANALSDNLKQYSLTLYSDKQESEGGRVRIIIAVPIVK